MLLQRHIWQQAPPHGAPYDPKQLQRFGVVGGFVPSVAGSPQLVGGLTFNNVLVQAPFQSVPAPFGTATRVVDAGGSRFYEFSNTRELNPRNFTFLARVKLGPTVTTALIMRLLPFGSGNTIPLWRNGGQFDMRVNGTDYTGAGTWSLDRWYDVEIVGTQGSCILYVDGLPVISGGAASATGSIGKSFFFMDFEPTGAQTEYGYVLFCDRALQDAERRSLRARPWQLFSPAPVWVPVSAGGGATYTLSAATYVPGSLLATSVQPRVTRTKAP